MKRICIQSWLPLILLVTACTRTGTDTPRADAAEKARGEGKACAGPNEPTESLYGKPCCAGLGFFSKGNVSGPGTCAPPDPGPMHGTCADTCGNGTCDEAYEDECNCKADCPPTEVGLARPLLTMLKSLVVVNGGETAISLTKTSSACEGAGYPPRLTAEPWHMPSDGPSVAGPAARTWCT